MINYAKIKSRKKRVKQTAEVFTPDILVNEMLDKLPSECWNEGKTFCDPAVGNGQFLVHVLQRKLDKKHNPLDALKTLFGADIMRDNIKECRMRLLAIIENYEPITDKHVYTVMRNIVWINKKKYVNGSLDYDFSFGNYIKQEDVQRWLDWIKQGKLDEVADNLPVRESKTKDDVAMDEFYDIDTSESDVK